jgi:hypothetical protein
MVHKEMITKPTTRQQKRVWKFVEATELMSIVGIQHIGRGKWAYRVFSRSGRGCDEETIHISDVWDTIPEKSRANSIDDYTTYKGD